LNTNPAIEFMSGNADPFHVCFTGVISPSGFKVPDLGVHVLDLSEIEIDISLGEGCDNQSGMWFSLITFFCTNKRK